MESLKSLTKALDILNLFLEQRKALSISEMCSLTGFNKTTVCRMAATLKKRGYLNQKERRGKYFVGPIYTSFYNLTGNKLQIRNIAGPYLIKLGKKINENVVLTYGDGLGFVNEIMYESTKSKNSAGTIPYEGRGFPRGTAAGKLILAELPENELQSYYDAHKDEFKSKYNLSNFQKLKEEIMVIRSEKVAYDDEVQNNGVRGVSAGLRNRDGFTIGAVSVAVPAARLSKEKMSDLGQLLKITAIQISRELGLNE